VAKPFEDTALYESWRDAKLSNFSTRLDNYLVEIKDPLKLSSTEFEKIRKTCGESSFCLIKIKEQSDYALVINKINSQLGLIDYDKHLYVKTNGLASITVSKKTDQSEFIPYTDRELGWHTDGYYNEEENRVRSFTLFCVNPSLSGGETSWVDHELIYIKLYEESRDIIEALCHPKAMTIPANIVNDKTLRPESTGPIFFNDHTSNALYMRYTQRKKNIQFHDSLEISQAVEALDKLLEDIDDIKFSHRFNRNEGLLTNNVLHKRTSFIDNPDQPRLLLRGRYFNRIN